MGPKQIQLSDFVGEHGSYQLAITIFLFVRYVFLGLMANSGPLMTPDVTFYCQLPMEEIVAIMPNITMLNRTEQELEIKEEFKRICQIDLHLYQQAYLNSTTKLLPNAPNKHKFNATDKIRECADFIYEIAPDQGRTMTSEFDLVCDRDWLRSLFQSLISAAIVVAHVFWGTFSDKYGRYKAQKLCFVVSLLAGGLSIFAMNFWTFVVARALCSFGDLGLVVSLTTTVVELVGNQYRGISVAIVNFGFALGVTILPYIVAYFEDFRMVIVFTVLCHLITIPFILTTNESIRWLLTNRKFHSAKKELKRIARWNKHSNMCFSLWLLMNWRYVQHQHQDRRTKFQKNENRQAFELLFKRFIDQIESQNFCDPLGSSDLNESNSPHPSIITQSGSSVEHVTTLPSPSLSLKLSRQLETQIKSGSLEGLDKRRFSMSACPLNFNSVPNFVNENNQPSIVDSSPSSLLIQKQQPGHNHEKIFIKKSLQQLATTDRHQIDHMGGSCSQLDNMLEQPKKKELRPYKSQDKLHGLSVSISMFVLPIDKSSQEKASEELNKSEEVNDDYNHAFVRHPAGQQQADCINLVASQLSFVGRVNRLFKDKQLMIAVFTIVWTTFNSELQYTSFIIINLEVGEDVYLNYILGGCMEALAAVTASLLLSYAPRRQSLITFWLLISFSCFGLSVAHIDSTWAVWQLALAKFSQSCLSSIASVAAYESFPTFLRQSGSGLVFTLGMLGSVFAPLIFAEFDDHAGMDRVLMTFSLSSLTAATLIYLYLKETKNCELQ